MIGIQGRTPIESPNGGSVKERRYLIERLPQSELNKKIGFTPTDQLPGERRAATAPFMRVAMLPATTDLRPSWAISRRLPETRAPMPPSMMPRLSLPVLVGCGAIAYQGMGEVKRAVQGGTNGQGGAPPLTQALQETQCQLVIQSAWSSLTTHIMAL